MMRQKKTALRVTKDAKPEERRQHRRKPCKKRARIEMNRTTSVDCVMVDKSRSGACLVHSGEAVIPQHIYISRGWLKMPQPAIVMWRSLNEVGVEFTR